MAKGRHSSENLSENSSKNLSKKNRNYIKIVRLFATILLIISILYIVNYFWKLNKEEKELKGLLNTVIVTDEPIIIGTERMAKVKKLQEQYTELMGWIEIEGTKINYPVMQSKSDNDFYLKYNYKKEKSEKGSIYLDKDYDWSIPSSNLLIYGHGNTRDSSMFADVIKYKKESFYKEHPTIRFTTDKDDSEYDIIAAFYSRVYYKSETNVFRYYYFINAENEQEYNEYVNNAKKASVYDTGKTAEYGDQLITLSTCEYSQEEGRFVVVARKNADSN